MKITKDYLRSLIKESISEPAKLDQGQVIKQITRDIKSLLKEVNTLSDVNPTQSYFRIAYGLRAILAFIDEQANKQQDLQEVSNPPLSQDFLQKVYDEAVVKTKTDPALYLKQLQNNLVKLEKDNTPAGISQKYILVDLIHYARSRLKHENKS